MTWHPFKKSHAGNGEHPVPDKVVEHSRRDLTRAESEDEQFYTGIIDAVPYAVVCIDSAGAIILANKVAHNQFGIVVGMTVEASELHWLGQIFAQAIKSPRSLRVHDTKNAVQFTDRGEAQFFIPTAFPYFAVGGSPWYVTIILTDVTLLSG
jgi:PAS domain-containing protein